VQWAIQRRWTQNQRYGAPAKIVPARAEPIAVSVTDDYLQTWPGERISTISRLLTLQAVGSQ
jgi:hypothetical protein